MLSSFERQILEVISKNNGIKAVSIAKELGVDKTKVNSKLYGKLKFFVGRILAINGIPTQKVQPKFIRAIRP